MLATEVALSYENKTDKVVTDAFFYWHKQLKNICSLIRGVQFGFHGTKRANRVLKALTTQTTGEFNLHISTASKSI